MQGRELAVRVEDVKLTVVLAKRGSRIGAAGVVDGLDRPLALAHDHGLEDAEQLVAIAGEVLQDVDRAALVAEDGYEIDGCHLRAEELFSRRKGAELVSRAHRRHVEIESQQAAILVAFAVRSFRRDLCASETLVELELFGAGRCDRQGQCVRGKVLVLAEGDLLWCAVLGDREVLCGESKDEFSLLILHHHCFDDQLRLDRDSESPRLARRRVLTGLLSGCVGGG